MPQALRLGMVAGEASGDLLASLLLAGLSQRWPQRQAFGIGGPRMSAQGFRAWWPSDRLAVHGYVDALRHYRELARIRRCVAERLRRERPDAFVGVDAPDFNLGLEKWLKADGIRTIHFVCPSVWAWRGGRAKTIAASADRVLCLFPFEPALLERHGVRATYVGHPLADAIPLQPPRAAARAGLGLGEGEVVVALLPGSRRAEIHHITPVLLQAAIVLAQRRGDLRFVLPVAPGLGALVDALVARARPPHLQVVDGRSHEVLAASDLTLVASGTATLEAALFKLPMVVVYRMGRLGWALMRRMAYQPWVGLPNILSREFVVPELIQDACTPTAIADAALRQLDDPAGIERLRARFTDLHLLLRRDTARAATDAIAQEIGA
jgi:lipid-A-disaccharide synthase